MGAKNEKTTSAIAGHEKRYGMLVRAAQSGQLHHAYLFVGPSGIGKKEVAHSLARFLACKSPCSEFPCGRCASCAMSSHHPDIHMLGHEGETISIDSIRALKRTLRLSSSLGGARSVIIDDAHDLNRESVNALLKLIEEPSQEVYFFLISHYPSQLPKTIVSRVHTVRLYPMSATALRTKMTSAVDSKLSALVGAFAHGRAGFALAFSKWLKEEGNMEALRALMSIVGNKKLFLWPEWQRFIEPKEPLAFPFHVLVEHALHIALAFCAGTLDSSVAHALEIERNEDDPYVINSRALIRAIEVCQTTNASQRMAWEQALWSTAP